MSFLGLDIGGSACKAMAFREDGEPLAMGRVEYSMVRPRPGWMEFDTEAQWQALRAAVRRVTADEKLRHDPVRALGISVAGDAIVPVDSAGRPLYNSIATQDSRGGEPVPWWEERLGTRRIYEITGQIPDRYHAINRILWFREAMPEIYATAWKFLCWEDLLLIRLGLTPVTDHSLAARTMAFDVRNKCWSEEILNAAGIDIDRFPKSVAPGTIAGELSSAVADDLGLPPKTRVVTGGFDQVCAAVGAGIVKQGMTLVGTGSMESVSTPTAFLPDFDSLKSLHFVISCHAVPGQYLVMGGSFTAGSLVRWYRDVLGAEERAEAEASGRDAFEIISETIPSEPTDILVLPHFTGGFCPCRDPLSKGAILGLTLATTKPQLFRALLEGIAMDVRMIIEAFGAVGIPIGPVRVAGGGAKCRSWLQIRADIFEREVSPMRVAEAGCLGAAILAAAADGVYPSIPKAAELMSHLGGIIRPSAANVAFYNGRFELYKRLYPAISDIQSSLGSHIAK